MRRGRGGLRASIGYIAAPGDVRQCVEIGAEPSHLDADLLGAYGRGPSPGTLRRTNGSTMREHFPTDRCGCAPFGDRRCEEVASAACGWLG